MNRSHWNPKLLYPGLHDSKILKFHVPFIMEEANMHHTYLLKEVYAKHSSYHCRNSHMLLPQNIAMHTLQRGSLSR